MTEYELEQTLLDRLQRFMLDFSGELCFRARQLRLAGNDLAGNDEGDCLESAIGTDPTRFNAPFASAQTLADDASPYYAEFPSTHGLGWRPAKPAQCRCHARQGSVLYVIGNRQLWRRAGVFKELEAQFGPRRRD